MSSKITLNINNPIKTCLYRILLKLYRLFHKSINYRNLAFPIYTTGKQKF